MEHHVVGEDRDFVWDGDRTHGKMWNQPVVGSLEFEITFNKDFSAREGVLKPTKMKILKLKLREERKKVTPKYVEYKGEVTGLGQHRKTVHRIYRDAYVEVLSGGEEGTLERRATISPELSDEEWKVIRGE